MNGPSTLRARVGLAMALYVVAACGSDRGVPENIAGGYTSGGVDGLTHYACYRNPNLSVGGGPTVTIDAKIKLQTMQGFGASMRLFDDPLVTNTLDPVTKRATAVPTALDQRLMLDALWLDAGLTRLRFFPGDGGIEPVNDNADPLAADTTKFDFSWNKGDAQLALMPTMSLRGVRTYFASTTKLESWMSESNPAEYAEWLMVMLRHWRDRGYELPYVSLKNEPGLAASGGVWSAAYMRDVTKILGARIKAEGMKTKIVLPDDVSAREALGRLQVILADADARQYIGAVAYHSGAGGGELEVKQLADQYGIPIWVTGFSAPDWQDMAVKMQALIADDGAAALDYTWGFYGDQETSQLIRVIASNGAYERFSLRKQYYALGQLARYVPPGAVRVSATSNDDSMLPLAFVDGAKLIIFVFYTGGPYERPVSIDLLAGAPCVKRLTSVRTSDSESWNEQPQLFIEVPRISLILPARTMITLVGQE
jgi:O-glycosyl hydrolase